MVADHTPNTDTSNDAALLNAARGGDPNAFALLIQKYHPTLSQLARFYTDTETAANETARTIWHLALTGPDPFEQNTSLKTWVYRAVIDQARNRHARNGSLAPFAATTRLVDDPYTGAVAGGRLKPSTDPAEPLHWIAFPQPWNKDSLLEAPCREAVQSIIENALDALSLAQQEVIMLRDVLAWTAEEVADALTISDSNQRALLHRARSAIRTQLEEHLTP